MIYLLRSFLMVSALLCTVQISASSDVSHIPRTEIVSLQAKDGGKYDLIVSLPNNYGAHPNVKYPTLYYLDGHWDATVLTSIYELMRLDNLVPDLILVGLSYPDAPSDWPRRRMTDYTPTKDSALSGSGGGDKFLKFLSQQVIPMIEEDYKSDPKQRAIAGHSLGGLFALYTMFEQPMLFKRVMALSPSALTGPDYLLNAEKRFYSKGNTLETRLFFSYGVAEPQVYVNPILEFEDQFSTRDYVGLTYKFKALSTVKHVTSKLDGYVTGLPWLYRDLAPEGETGFASFINKAYKDSQIIK